MKKYLLGILTIAFVVSSTAFVSNENTVPPGKKIKTTSVKKEDPLAGCVWFQFTGNAQDINSVKNSTNWLEYTGNPATLCNNVNVRVCAICVKTTNVSGTAPNRHIVSFSNIYFNFSGPGGYYYAIMPGPSDLEAYRNRN